MSRTCNKAIHTHIHTHTHTYTHTHTHTHVRSGGVLFTDVTSVEDPLHHSDVVSEAGPHELARSALAEPVDVEHLGQLLGLGPLSEREPAPGRSAR